MSQRRPSTIETPSKLSNTNTFFLGMTNKQGRWVHYPFSTFCPHTALLLIIFIVFVFMIYNGHVRKVISSNSTTSKSPIPDTQKTLVVQRSTHYVANDIVVNSLEELHAEEGDNGNVGNFIWMAGGLALLDTQSPDHFYCQNHRDACVQTHPVHRNVVHYIPSSYMLADKKLAGARSLMQNRMAAFTRNMSMHNEPFFFVGIGTQSSFHQDHDQNDFAMADTIVNSPDDYDLVDEGVTMLKKLQQMKTTVFFRGAFSNKVAKLSGYTYGVETGCPSYMLNTNVRLGQMMQPKYDSISKRINDRSIKVAVNVAAGMMRLRAWYLNILKTYPNSVLYLQNRHESAFFEKNGVPFERFRYFPRNVESWIESLSSMDVSIGSRIHGSMAALAAGIPLYIIAPDFRVSEMAQSMALPYTNIYDKRLLDDKLDIARLFKDIRFNGNNFDKNRCRIAKIYQDKLGRRGVKLAPHVVRISNIC